MKVRIFLGFNRKIEGRRLQRVKSDLQVKHSDFPLCTTEFPLFYVELF